MLDVLEEAGGSSLVFSVPNAVPTSWVFPEPPNHFLSLVSIGGV